MCAAISSPVSSDQIQKRKEKNPDNVDEVPVEPRDLDRDRKSTRLNSSHLGISYAVFCLKKQRVQPSINVCAHLILGKTITLLDFALQLFAPAVNLREIIIGEFAPLFFDLSRRLFPLSLHTIPGHNPLP